MIKTFFGYGNGKDRIFMKGREEPILSLPEGTITNLKDKKEYTKFEIADKKYAEKVFQAVITNTDVEWAHIRHADINNSESSLIINNHDDQDVSTSAMFAKYFKSRGDQTSLFEHSHPLKKDFRRNGIPNIPFTFPPSPDDIRTATYYPGTTFRVYDVYNNKIFEYDKNGIKKIF